MSDGKSLSPSYFSFCAKLGETLGSLTRISRAYLSVFPASLSHGLFSTESVSKKTIATAYYEYAAALCRLLDQVEADVLAIGQLMQDADKEMDSETVLYCDALMEQYVQFHGALNECLEQSEGLLRKETEVVPLSKLFRYAQKLQAHAEQVEIFLKQELQNAPQSP